MRRHISPHSAGRSQQRGYALLIMLVLVTMGILFTLVSQLDVVSMKWGRSQNTQATLLQAKEALIGYAATYRDTHAGEVFGYLPCPDADGDGAAETSNTDGTCGGSDQAVVGLLPYKTLGLGDLRDASGECLWYAVSPGQKASMNKVEPMNWDTRGQIKIFDSDGTTVLADPADGIEGGAVAVIFAASPPLTVNATGRGGNSNNVCGNNGKAVWAAYLESAAFDSNGNSTASPLIVTRGTIDGVSNNDQITWITPKEIFDRVKKRSDQGGVNALSTAAATSLTAKINTDLVTSAAPASALPATDYATISGPTPYAGYVGTLPSLTISSDPNNILNTFLDNWSNQYRYVVCSNLCGYCLNVGGQSCNGALLFGAENPAGGPRPVQPTQLTDLFETDGATNGDGKGALGLANGTSNLFSGTSAYSSGAADVGVCLAPSSAKPITFNCSLTNFLEAAPTNLVTISGQNITLGKVDITTNNGYSSSNLFGCAWSNDVLTFGAGLRTYFNFVISNSGRGFTLSIIDAIKYPASTAPCGRSDQYLGYAGNNGVSSPIDPPKIGLEIHTTTSTSSSSQGGPGYRHAALVYWGNNNISADNDDNIHGAINTVAGYPSNPKNRVDDPASTGVSGNLGPTPSGSGVLVTGITVHVRIDIVRSYDASAHQGSYNIKAWLVKSPTAAQLADLQNITQDFISSTSGSLATTVSDAFTTLDLPTGATSDPEALQKIRIGFTNAQGASDQVITLQNFGALSR
ncbi:conserved protein of unknown function [Georgfuchsia toluolica]|uniref:Uncharacterized protein n=1 Tax=Georgfuchsia toluolica TaxID=424218 RepID=A0A916J5B2_9PROT|nr:hypothetical protein [Georgfuchsia toluolica]CAG4884236.1 conserved protein of unknown function [Georgfuchsia toluolica]